MKTVTLEYLFLDRDTCTRCRGTDDHLDQAARLLEPVLASLDRRLEVRRTRVATAEQAARLGLRTSPTVRVDGRDLQPDFRESRCGSCSDLAPAAGGVDCREWSWQGGTWTEAPVGLLVEGVLRSALGDARPAPVETAAPLPGNLKAFFDARACDCCEECPPAGQPCGCGC